ncbi:MAG TPA: hypothetical protein VM599_06465 [Thermoanaerobaculia bacterium]|nr:hypothetical protein [Thermoanaerobaculia bacterium]
MTGRRLQDEAADPLAAPRLRTLAWLLPPLLLGAGLRLWGLSRQVLTGDEVHGVARALDPSLAQVFRYQGVDHCIPLTALFRLLSWAGIGLSETVVRAPSVAAGLLTLVLLPLLAARWGGARVGALLAWLLAVSPSLIYYSRIARPYALVALLACLAAAAFWRWYRGGGAALAAGYAAAGALTLWLHPGFAPFVAAPLAYAAAESAGRAATGRGPGVRRPAALAAVATALALGVALFLVPAWRSFRRVLAHKAGEGSVGPETVGDVLLLQAGTAVPGLALLAGAAAAVGLAVLLGRRPGFALYGITLIAAQWLAVAVVLQPAKVFKPIVLNRYVLVALPIFLLWAACGLAEVWRRSSRRHRLLGPVLPAAVVAALLLGGPHLADPYLRFGPFAGTNAALALYDPPPALPADRVPEAYRLMAREPGGGAVLEAATRTVAAQLDATIALSRHHGRPVILGVDRPWARDPRLALTTVVDIRARTLCGSRARFLVVHGDRAPLERLVDELVAGGAPPPESPAPHWRPVPLELAGALEAECGEPYLRSPELALWDLERTRSLGRPRPLPDDPGRAAGSVGAAW